MPARQNSRYPYHLAKLVAARLISGNVEPPSDRVLLRFFETLYFSSLKTDESRPCRCTVNYVDPQAPADKAAVDGRAGRWRVIPFAQSMPFDVRTLLKLARAADPNTSSLAVFSDAAGELFIWGIVDQELRYADFIAAGASASPHRPGLFQATIAGVGNLCVYKDYALLGSLEQHNLVDQYHDALGAGPVHEALRTNLRAALADGLAASNRNEQSPDAAPAENELLVRWQNAVCRTLMNIQRYRHGGGLLIVPACPAADVNVKYAIHYDRLPQSLVGLVQCQLLKHQTATNIAEHCRSRPGDVLPCEFHFDDVAHRKKLDEYKSEALGCERFIASLSRVDGFVLLDKGLVVHGFGVESVAESDLEQIFIAGDAPATPSLLRPGTLSHFGTRHRAMMRYCWSHPGALGFVISQNGDIRATMRVGDRLILWENINVQLAFKAEHHGAQPGTMAPTMPHFQMGTQSTNCAAS